PTLHDGSNAVAIALEDVSLREVLAERLMESENRLQRLVSSVGDAIVAADARGRIILWNEAATRTFGYTELETLGESFAMLFPRDQAEQYTSQHFATGALAALNRTTFSRGRRKSGATFPTQMSFASSDFGGAVWFTAVIHDDSERQQLIDSLGRSEASFRALVEQSPDPLFVHGPGRNDREVIYANDSMHALLGHDLGKLVGRSVETFVHPEDRKKLAEYRRVEPRATLELRWLTADGSVLDIQVVSRVVRFEDRPAVLVFARDVTDRLRQERERARAEAVLRQSEERHRIMFDANPLASWMLDPETLRFTSVNDAMVRTYGYSREELLQLTMLDLRVKEGDVQSVDVKRHRRKDGAMIDVDITVHPIPLAGGTMVLGIGKDVTNELRLEEQLRQTQKMEAVGQLAGGIAHDFNNILAVITANTDLALEELGRDHPVAAELVEIDAAATRAAGLTRQLLAFSRKERREVKQLALNGIVTNLEKMLSRIVGEDIAISALLASQLGTIEGDAGQVEQILMNLLVNARDAMPGGGRVLIETANAELDELDATTIGISAGHYVMLSVKDTGCGMDKSVRAHIFEPFFTTKEIGKGTGLGLSTVFGIVKQSGGAITVESDLGQGTTFRIYFPRVHNEADVAPQQPRFVAPQGSGTVLLVEDDVQLRLVLRRYLIKWGFTLLEAATGTAALELARSYKGPIDLLLTDLVMPELDGRSLSKLMLAERPSTRVVLMSGYTEHPALQNAELGPADHFMQKPFTAQALSETLRRVLVCLPRRVSRN
ncbi:MAG: PAS domain S-box protein, partial [Deltaproteobacteria bacterium]|nr:PAS domain S-box protein [Deltaproteobacteria bacterium]